MLKGYLTKIDAKSAQQQRAAALWTQALVRTGMERPDPISIRVVAMLY